jgi:hypothetical protein
MDIISFKDWVLITQIVEGECNCFLIERFEDLITSSKESMIKELCDLMKEYSSYVKSIIFERCN